MEYFKQKRKTILKFKNNNNRDINGDACKYILVFSFVIIEALYSLINDNFCKICFVHRNGLECLHESVVCSINPQHECYSLWAIRFNSVYDSFTRLRTNSKLENVAKKTMYARYCITRWELISRLIETCQWHLL